MTIRLADFSNLSTTCFTICHPLLATSQLRNRQHAREKARRHSRNRNTQRRSKRSLQISRHSRRSIPGRGFTDPLGSNRIRRITCPRFQTKPLTISILAGVELRASLFRPHGKVGDGDVVAWCFCRTNHFNGSACCAFEFCACPV